jgi:hypothetical protein
MYIYKNYNSREEIERDYKNGKLQIGYIFAYDRRLYEVIDSKFTFYRPLQIIRFNNIHHQRLMTQSLNLLYYDGDIIEYDVEPTQEERELCCLHV